MTKKDSTLQQAKKDLIIAKRGLTSDHPEVKKLSEEVVKFLENKIVFLQLPTLQNR